MSGAQASGGVYIYGVVHREPFQDGDNSLDVAAVGDGGSAVRTVEYRDLAAIVSDFPADRCDVTRENVLAHQRVLERAMERSDVLPAAFGLVAENDADVREKLLRPEFEDLHRALDSLRGRVELELKVLWNREALFSEIVEESDEIATLRDSIAGLSPEATYYERINLGEMVAAEIDRRSDQVAEEVLDALQPLSVETRLNENLTDMTVLNASFLVEKKDVPDFDARVQELGARSLGRLNFHYVGPLPPYSFVDVSLSLEE